MAEAKEIYGPTITLHWHKPIDVGDIEYDKHHPEVKDIVDDAGIYLFLREYGDSQEILYVGKASQLRRRIMQQLNARELVEHIQNSKRGKKILRYATIEMNGNANKEKYLDEVESKFISMALDLQDDIFNKRKTTYYINVIVNSGNYKPGKVDRNIYLVK
ncbi:MULTISPECIES: hypothetical protein [unclassified Brenneria]|uniref:hypothetical protein n=1 Tax=unclassified Brenneria TaxID=2634434 RepID=UPI0029C3E689|nr:MULTISPECIES: hypothetical protein [unclassified Brenneria]MDX5630733.1 hypothetical protein [Brenneria sp. L3-3Z]MDX5694215.1 hypothetical protein [Brenneria sp. L4-2C]